MPVHDWTRVRANRFHDFHQSWTIRLRDALNAGLLPDGYLAMAEQITGGPEPDVVSLSLPGGPPRSPGGLVLMDTPPKVRVRTQAEVTCYADAANRVVIQHPDGDVVAVIEIVSPGNKDSKHALRAFTRKSVAFLRAGVSLLVVDLFPPSRRDPHGLHKAIWDRIHEEPFDLPAGQPLTAAAYTNNGVYTGYVENFAVGDPLPEMPLFLTPEWYVPCPLEATYQASWAVLPAALKAPLEETG